MARRHAQQPARVTRRYWFRPGLVEITPRSPARLFRLRAGTVDHFGDARSWAGVASRRRPRG